MNIVVYRCQWAGARSSLHSFHCRFTQRDTEGVQICGERFGVGVVLVRGVCNYQLVFAILAMPFLTLSEYSRAPPPARGLHTRLFVRYVRCKPESYTQCVCARVFHRTSAVRAGVDAIAKVDVNSNYMPTVRVLTHA